MQKDSCRKVRSELPELSSKLGVGESISSGLHKDGPCSRTGVARRRVLVLALYSPWFARMVSKPSAFTLFPASEMFADDKPIVLLASWTLDLHIYPTPKLPFVSLKTVKEDP